jgi:hypothetical protein
MEEELTFFVGFQPKIQTEADSNERKEEEGRKGRNNCINQYDATNSVFIN